MKHLDLFSGIGGFALAARWCGIETVAFCEIEPYACKVLNKNFPNIPIHDDVRRTDEFIQYRGQVDLITGGYPCQPFSVAGKQRGQEDDRHLWPAMLEIIKTVRPTWILAENVAGHIKLGLDEVLSDLEGEGYTARPIVIPACAVNAPHRRDRVWIIAYSDLSRPKSIPSNSGSLRLQRSTKESFPRIEHIQWKLIRSGETIAFCKYPNKPGVLRNNDGIPNRVDRIRGLGNAIVPQVAYEIMQAMINEQTQR